MEPRYDLYLTGTLNDGTDRDAAIAAYAELDGINAQEAGSLFANAPCRVRSDCDEAECERFGLALRERGIRYVRRPAGEALIPPDQPPPRRPGPGDGRRPEAFEFHGNGYEYFRIWIVNLLLTIVTLGFYAPWAKVRNRQYFCGNTRLDGASFEYTASPIKLLIGRIVALVLLFAYYMAGVVSPAASSMLSVLVMVAIPWAANKSMAFNARNTVYRNIRFRFRGEYPQAFLVFILWPLAGVLTAGLLMPVALQRWQRYRIDNHAFGDKSFRFGTGSGPFYKLCLAAFVMVIIGVAAGLGVAALLPQAGAMGFTIGFGLGYALALVYIATGLNNLVFNGATLASHRFSGNFSFAGYGWIMVSNFLLMIVTLGLFIPWAKVRVARYVAEHVQLHVSGDLDSFVAITQQDEKAFGEEFGDVFDLEFGF